MSIASVAASRWDRAGCPVCGGTNVECFFEAANVPVRDGLLFDSAHEAAAAPTGNLRLSVCKTCFYIGNEDYQPRKARLDGYDFSLQHSPAFRRFVRGLSAHLIARYGLRKSAILDVGCGDALFLKTICAIGDNVGVGIEPAFEPEVGPNETVTVIHDRFSEAEAVKTYFDLIACRHVLSEVHQPAELLRSIRKGTRNPACFVYLEVPNAAHTFRQKVVWNLVYEHRSWYLPEGLANLCLTAGLEVRDIRACWNSEYLSMVAVRAGSATGRRQRRKFATASITELASFGRECRQIVDAWQITLADWRRTGLRVVAWGAGARAVTFFSHVDCHGVIDAVIDINPIRWGKYLPVSAIRVERPQFIQRFKPDLVLITNPTYASEIQAHVKRLGVRCRFDQL
jgi:SAM-dependent methyltransferase